MKVYVNFSVDDVQFRLKLVDVCSLFEATDHLKDIIYDRSVVHHEGLMVVMVCTLAFLV